MTQQRSHFVGRIGWKFTGNSTKPHPLPKVSRVFTPQVHPGVKKIPPEIVMIVDQSTRDHKH